jgi:hypothetical protein
VNASATLNTSSGCQGRRGKPRVGSSLGQLDLQRSLLKTKPQAGALLAKLAICGSKIRRIFPNANYSNLPLLWQPAVKDA